MYNLQSVKLLYGNAVNGQYNTLQLLFYIHIVLYDTNKLYEFSSSSQGFRRFPHKPN